MDAPRCTVTAVAVLFDLDGVLVDSTAAVEGHWRDFAARHGLDATALLADLHGRRMVDVIAGALPSVGPAQLADEARLVESAEANGARDGTQPQPGALDLVRALDLRPWAIVTSGTSPVALARIEAVGLPRPPVFVPGCRSPVSFTRRSRPARAASTGWSVTGPPVVGDDHRSVRVAARMSRHPARDARTIPWTNCGRC